MDALEDILALKLADSAAYSIHDVARRAPGLRRLSRQIGGEIGRRRGVLLAELADRGRREALVARMAEGMFRFLADQYQYLELGDRERAELAALYARFLSETRRWLAGAFEPEEGCPPLVRHHERLSAWTRARLDAVDALDWAENSDAEVVSANYSAPLQLHVLGLDADVLAEPVLDLGCGAEARLVRSLRRRGIAAFGIDRLAPDGVGIMRGSWFDAPLDPCSWGTIIAHHAFALHFLNAHLGGAARAVRYGRHYMRILHALAPGGVFAYAPGLPFIERHLDPLAFEVSTSDVRPNEAASSGAFRSSRVRRR